MEENKRIKLTDVECVDNRKMEGVGELAANIKVCGLIQPIVLAANFGKMMTPYRVVDGRRRFHALELIGREYLEPGEWRIDESGDDKLTAFSANFVRQNLTLAEEVAQIGALRGTYAEIASWLGKSEHWVALRSRLSCLTGKWTEVLDNPDVYLDWTPAKLELIAREPESVQKELECKIGWNLSMDGLKRALEECHRLLSAAPFDTAVCRECPKRSGAQGVLFADFDAKKDTCLDKACFGAKALAFVKELRSQKPLIPISGGYYYTTSAEKSYADKVKAKSDWEFADVRKPKKGEEPNAIIVTGENIGRLMVAVSKKTDKKAAEASVEPKEKTVKEREADLAAKRNKVALQKLREHLQKTDSVEEWMKRGELDEQAAHRVQLQHVMWFGLKGDNHFCVWDTPKFKDDGKFAKMVFAHVKNELQSIVTSELNRMLGDMSKTAVKDICGMLFLDLAEFRKAAEAEIPEPKSLIAARIKEKQAKAEKKTAKASGK